MGQKKGRFRIDYFMRQEDVIKYDVVKDWLNSLKGSEVTRNNYLYGLTLFIDWIKKDPATLIKERIEHVKSEDMKVRKTEERELDRFYNERQSKQVGLFVIRAMKSFYSYHGMPLVGFKSPNQDDIIVRVREHIPSTEEIRRMCDLAENVRDKLILLVLAETGMRIGSLVRLQYWHVKDDFEANKSPCKVIVPLYEKEYQRYGYMTFICNDAITTLRDHLNYLRSLGVTITDTTYIFPRYVGTHNKIAVVEGKYIGENGVMTLIRELGMSAGIIKAKKGLREFRGHNFRKRAQTILESSNIPLNWVDLMLCHEPRGSNAKAYSRPTEEDLRQAYSKAMDRLMVYGGASPTLISEVEAQKNEIENLKRELFSARFILLNQMFDEFTDEDIKHFATKIGIKDYEELLKSSGFVKGDDGVWRRSNKSDPKKIISEDELESYLNKGWDVQMVLPSGKILLSKNVERLR